MSRQDAAFFTHTHDAEVLWRPEGSNPKEVRVYRNGEMRINYTEPSGEIAVLRYTDDLEGRGIDSDEKLLAAEESGLIEWINNAWFEVAWVDNEDGEIVGEIDVAIAYAQQLLDEADNEPQGCSHCWNPDFSCACTGGVGRQTQVEVVK